MMIDGGKNPYSHNWMAPEYFLWNKIFNGDELSRQFHDKYLDADTVLRAVNWTLQANSPLANHVHLAVLDVFGRYRDDSIAWHNFGWDLYRRAAEAHGLVYRDGSYTFSNPDVDYA